MTNKTQKTYKQVARKAGLIIIASTLIAVPALTASAITDLPTVSGDEAETVNGAVTHTFTPHAPYASQNTDTYPAAPNQKFPVSDTEALDGTNGLFTVNAQDLIYPENLTGSGGLMLWSGNIETPIADGTALVAQKYGALPFDSADETMAWATTPVKVVFPYGTGSQLEIVPDAGAPEHYINVEATFTPHSHNPETRQQVGSGYLVESGVSELLGDTILTRTYDYTGQLNTTQPAVDIPATGEASWLPTSYGVKSYQGVEFLDLWFEGTATLTYQELGYRLTQCDSTDIPDDLNAYATQQLGKRLNEITATTADDWGGSHDSTLTELLHQNSISEACAYELINNLSQAQSQTGDTDETVTASQRFDYEPVGWVTKTVAKPVIFAIEAVNLRAYECGAMRVDIDDWSTTTGVISESLTPEQLLTAQCSPESTIANADLWAEDENGEGIKGTPPSPEMNLFGHTATQLLMTEVGGTIGFTPLYGYTITVSTTTEAPEPPVVVEPPAEIPTPAPPVVEPPTTLVNTGTSPQAEMTRTGLLLVTAGMFLFGSYLLFIGRQGLKQKEQDA